MTHSSTSMRTGGRSREHVYVFVSVCWNVCFRVWSVIIGYIKRNVVLKHMYSAVRNSQDLLPSGRVGSGDETTGLSRF